MKISRRIRAINYARFLCQEPHSSMSTQNPSSIIDMANQENDLHIQKIGCLPLHN